jgi:hypothetical protein
MALQTTTACRRPASDVDGCGAVLAHSCLNALATLRIGLEVLNDREMILGATERSLLVADLRFELSRLERLAFGMARGVPVP